MLERPSTTNDNDLGSGVVDRTSNGSRGNGKGVGIALGLIGGIALIVIIVYTLALRKMRANPQRYASHRQDGELSRTTFKGLNQAIIDTFTVTTFKAHNDRLDTERDEKESDDGSRKSNGYSFSLSKLSKDHPEPDLEKGEELEEDCSICSETFVEGQEVRILPCIGKHQYHNHCISEWLVRFGTSCPLCRKDFRENEVTTSVSHPMSLTSPLQVPPPCEIKK